MGILKGTQEVTTDEGQALMLEYYVIKENVYGIQIVKSVRHGSVYVQDESETVKGVSDNEAQINAIIEKLIEHKVTPVYLAIAVDEICTQRQQLVSI